MEIGLHAPAVFLCLPVGPGAADSLCHLQVAHTGKEEGVQLRHTDSAAPCTSSKNQGKAYGPCSSEGGLVIFVLMNKKGKKILLGKSKYSQIKISPLLLILIYLECLKVVSGDR